MKLPLIATPANFLLTNQSRKETGQGLFGDILTIKMQSFQADSGSEIAVMDEQGSSPNQVLANVLNFLRELQDQSGFDLDEAEQELLQETIDLLSRLDMESEGAASVVEEALDHFVESAENYESEGELDFEEFKVVLSLLHMTLQEFESLKNETSSFVNNNVGYSVLAPRQMAIQPITEQGMHGKASDNMVETAAGSFSNNLTNTEAKESLQAAIRLPLGDPSTETETGKEMLFEDTVQKGIQAGNQSKSDTNTALASNLNSASESEEVIVRLAETSSNESKARELIRQFTNVLQKSQFSQALQTKSLTIRLYPEHLGSLRIELVQRDGAMIARILASTSMAKEMLDSQIHQLRQAFVQQNIDVNKLDITFQEDLNKYSSHDQRNNGQEQQNPKEDKGPDVFGGENDEEDFSQFLQKVLFEMEV